MKKIVILCGIPGSGKSTWINKNNFGPYTISTDELRIQKTGLEMDLSGNFTIPNVNMWKEFYALIEERMKKGAFIIVDATHCKISTIHEYKNLVEKYEYEAFVLDLSVDKTTAVDRNKAREVHKRVPSLVIYKMANDYDTMKTNIKTLDPIFKFITESEFADVLKLNIVDLNKYEEIHHIGDIHGCATCLKEYLKEIKEENFYIFTGDYIDRGIENIETLLFIETLLDKENVVFIRGNHENHLENWANNEKITGKNFADTKAEFEKNGFSKDIANKIVKKLKNLFIYEFDGKVIFVNHAGIPTFENVSLINENQLVKGVGSYGDDIDAIFSKKMNGKEVYQIHGHRNKLKLPILASEKSFNLEGKIEFGGNLRCIVLDKNGFTPIETKNNVFSSELKDKDEE